MHTPGACSCRACGVQERANQVSASIDVPLQLPIAGLHAQHEEESNPAAAIPAHKKQRAVAPVPASLAPGWLPHIPALPQDSWASRCIRQWALSPPFDSTATDEQWHLYHDERQALELVQEALEGELARPARRRHTDWKPSQFADAIRWQDKGLGKPHLLEVCQTEQMSDLEAEDPEAWNRFDETKSVTSGTRTAVKQVLESCKGITGFEDLAARTAAGTFILMHDGDLLEVEEVRNFGVYSRIYSPACSPRALEIDFGWHHRMRWSTVEYFMYWFTLPRDPKDAKPLKPQDTALFRRTAGKRVRGQATLYKTAEDDDGVGFENRTLPTPSDLDKMQAHLFGQSHLLSWRKFFDLVVQAGCSSHKTCGHVEHEKASKVVARAFPDLLPGEECTSAPWESEEDEVSSNDELRERYLNWRARKAAGDEGMDEDDEEFGYLTRNDDW
ncbi:hypothetical protein DUNSADRAFT_13532 [Dunaliella salina]|uniref:Uncharacterized protein n=1 Tax=Dunaliella salina TaxID=3046 RepID=A0ABQ7G945_DUNSA|nr:hypothetical protein DUNSADRAFT_13532 [Dunaliella salina]|eukprot:KAF5831130.1 hypothetical protein DUNSADRAFT_13532 [Dunaliella salina]